MQALRNTARLAATAFYVATALFAMLVSIPFTWIQFIESDVVPAVGAFAVWHRWLALPAAGAMAWVLLTSRVPRGRARLLALVAGAVSVVITLRPVLPALTPEGRPLAWAAAALAFPIVAWGAEVLAARRGDGKRVSGANYTGLSGAALAAAVITWLLFAIAGAGFAWAGANLLLHAAAFGGVLAGVILAEEVGAIRGLPPRAGHALLLMLAVCTVGYVIDVVVFAALSWQGPLPAVFAAAIAGALILALAASVPAGPTIIDRAVGALTPASRPAGALLVAAIAVSAVALCRTVAPLDWNFMLQRLIACAAGGWLFAVLVRLLHRAGPVTSPRLWLALWPALVAPAAAYAVALAPADRVEHLSGSHASFGAIRALTGGGTRDAADDGLYEMLQSHTSLPRSLPVQALDVRLADVSAVRDGRTLPSIFILVIDSLRRDYLSPYNPAAGFTPRIEAFARGAAVFENAFSHYGATGLSQPSIWVGGLMPHLQYIQPFGPMNALQKLVDAGGYRPLVSYDTISRRIVDRGPTMIDIDAGVANMDYDLCGSLGSLTRRLETSGGAPIFSYTQPQNIHVATLARAGEPLEEDGRGFVAPIASRIARMDGCFGRFLDALDARGLTDTSIVVLTSDHGDSLGEDGRWGHAYTIFPEILRIPLIMRVPAQFRENLVPATGQTAFSTDITPTLYALAGLAPEADPRFFGQPLFVRDLAARAEYAGSMQLVASSYGPVYGVVDGGRRLYIVDAVNYRDYLYDLSADGGAALAVATSAERERYRRFIRTRLTELHVLYGVPALD